MEDNIYKILMGVLILFGIFILSVAIYAIWFFLGNYSLLLIPGIFLAWLVGHIYDSIENKSKTKDNDDKL